MPGAAPAVSRPLAAARTVWCGLTGVLVGADPAPGWRWRSPWHRRAAYGGLGAATLVACVASLACLDNLGNEFELGHPASVKAQAFVSVDLAARARVVHRGAYAALSPVPQFKVIDTAWLMPGGAMALAVLVALAVVVPLPLAARYPLLGWRIGWLALLLVPPVDTSSLGIRINWSGSWPWDPVQLLVLVVVFFVAGARHRRPVLWWMWALTLIPWWLEANENHPGLVAGVLGTIAFTAAAVAADALGSRRRDRQALAEQAERTELEQARRAVLEERAKIARELHDVVAHHMSLIAVRA
jgi:hypothetical protein